MSDHYEDDSEDTDFLAWFIRNTWEEAEAATYRLVLPDEIIDGLSWVQARNRAESAIRDAGWTVFNFEQTGWQVEYFVRYGNEFVIFATVEAEGE